MTDIHLETLLPVSPNAAYSLFTNATLLQQWLCNDAHVDVRVGGAYFYSWMPSWWVVGKYTAVEADKRLAFTWQPESAPSVTQVEITFTAEGDNTRIAVHHTGYDSALWTEQARAENLEGWTSALNDLAYFVENGLDARMMRRPLMGINFAPLTPELSSRLNCPTQDGIALTGIVEGSGASKAGLKTNDVLVRMDGVAIAHFSDLTAVIQKHNAGDTVPVEVYRNGEKHSLQLVFGQRPTPHIAASQTDLAAQMREQINGVIVELDAALMGVTEEEMMFQPAEGEWTIKQILAHCIWGERWSAMNIWSLAGGGAYVPWVGNQATQYAGILAVQTTGAALSAELKRAMYELPPMIEALDTAVLTNPALFKYIALINAETSEHIREHLAQIKNAVEAARQTVPA